MLTLSRRSLLSLALAGAIPSFARGASPIRFGLTGAVVRENLQLYDRLAEYLGRRVGRAVQFVQRRSYRETMEMLQTGDMEFAWICSYAYVRQRAADYIGLMATAEFRGAPLYRSYTIVHRASPFQHLGELGGCVFAYTDPESNSGYLVPRAMLLAMKHNPDRFFRQTLFTYSHSETIQAVAERVADAGAVDSYVWEYLNRFRPEMTARTKIVAHSDDFGFPPLVYRRAGDLDLRRRMTQTFLTMQHDDEGRLLLRELMLDRFIDAPDSLYDDVQRLAVAAQAVPLAGQ